MRHLRLSDSNVSGSDELSGNLLRSFIPFLFPVILNICNASLSSSKFPEAWKHSLITPVPKVKNPASPSDFRPISILSEVSKVLERIVWLNFKKYLTDKGIRDQYQFGFVEGCSTQIALIRIVDDVRSAVDKRMIAILVSLDFTKAFDTVDHALLLGILAKLGCSNSVLG